MAQLKWIVVGTDVYEGTGEIDGAYRRVLVGFTRYDAQRAVDAFQAQQESAYTDASPEMAANLARKVTEAEGPAAPEPISAREEQIAQVLRVLISDDEDLVQMSRVIAGLDLIESGD